MKTLKILFIIVLGLCATSCREKIEELPEYKQAICSFLESTPNKNINFVCDKDTIQLRVEGEYNNVYLYDKCYGRTKDKCLKRSYYAIAVYYTGAEGIEINHFIGFEYFTGQTSKNWSIRYMKDGQEINWSNNYDEYDPNFVETMKANIEYEDEEGAKCLVFVPGVGLQKFKIGERIYHRVE